jgi:hypothetical protein
MPNRKWDTDIWRANVRLIKNDLAFEPKVTFKEGFLNTFRWLESNSKIKRFYQDTIG